VTWEQKSDEIVIFEKVCDFFRHFPDFGKIHVERKTERHVILNTPAIYLMLLSIAAPARVAARHVQNTHSNFESTAIIMYLRFEFFGANAREIARSFVRGFSK
jgi:hypothetical protein